jgi:hypothetical protein
MRLRTTAPPSAFLMLNPKRLIGCPLARTNTVKWELERRLPVRYTSSNSLFRTSRTSRGNVRPAVGPSALLGRKAMTALLAARRQHLAATLGFHAHAKSVCLGAASFPRLICTLWQSIPPLILTPCNFRIRKTSGCNAQAAFCRGFPAPAALPLESSRVQPHHPHRGSIRNLLVYLPPAQRVKKTRGIVTRRGKVIHPYIPELDFTQFRGPFDELLSQLMCSLIINFTEFNMLVLTARPTKIENISLYIRNQ